MTVGWGIVGTGGQAEQAMAPAIAAVDGARLVGAVSRDAQRAADFAERHGAEHAWTSLDEMLASDDVDVVLITSPNALHAEQALAIAAAGKHILCDKPLALNTADAKKVVDACAQAGVKLGVNFQMRHTAWAGEARKLIASGAIGDVVAIQAEQAPGRRMLGGWRSDVSLAGLGSVNNIAVHLYDLLCFLLDSQVAQVMAMFNTEKADELETLAMTIFRFENGAMAYVNGNQAVPNPQNDVDIYGTEGRILGVNLSRHAQEGEMKVLTGEGEQTFPESTFDAFERSVADFTQAVENDTEPLATGLDGLRNVQLTDAIARSAREGKLVDVEYA